MKKISLISCLVVILGNFTGSTTYAEDTASQPRDWSSYVSGLVPLGDQMANQLTDPNDPLLRQELFRLMYATMAQGYFELVYQDSEYPDLWPAFNTAFNVVITNPDDSYYMTALKSKGVYKITGFRGTARIVDFQIASGQFFYTGLGNFGPTLRNYDLDKDVHRKKDGAFEVILSTERPQGYKGDWWYLDPKATHLLVRQISYDWLKEVDGRFAIERLDLPAIKPRDSAEKIAGELKNIPLALENWTRFSQNFTKKLRDRGMVNKIDIVDFNGFGGVSTQKYMNGLFDLGPDEALILETEIPKGCYYWSFTMYDELWAVIDWQNRQTSLNGHMARMDRDGKFRAVISAQDPGVPNWLDSAGYQRGGIFGRFNHCEGNQQPTLTKVKFADVRKYLPSETPVVTAEARDVAIRLRRQGSQLRRRW